MAIRIGLGTAGVVIMAGCLWIMANVLPQDLPIQIFVGIILALGFALFINAFRE